MEDYFAAIKNGSLGTIEDIKKAYENEGIKVMIEKYEDEYQMVVGNAEDVLRITVQNDKAVFITWQLGTGDEMVLELTPEILEKFGLSNDPDANYE